STGPTGCSARRSWRQVSNLPERGTASWKPAATAERPPMRDDDTLAWLLAQTGGPRSHLAARRPDFLVVSPPKTRSTSLADTLRHHPQAFVPAVKEVKYFSSFFRSLDLGWYLAQFAPAAGRLKGEASPSYAMLPRERIRLVRALLPRLKLVYLMREPIARAWSHARHNHRYREANFASCRAPLDAVPDEEWQANFTQDWTLASGDYLGQLRRWLAVFPKEQVFVGFSESIAERPPALLAEVFAFLGLDPGVDLSTFPVTERILAGPPGQLPPSLWRFLHGLLHRRSLELVAFLRGRLGLEPPPAWRATL